VEAEIFLQIIMSRENKDAKKNPAAVIVNVIGKGRVINMADNPNFRLPG
jgi:glutamine amidotransferase-like uncharacterized protein